MAQYDQRNVLSSLHRNKTKTNLEREKLYEAMKHELADLQNHREQLADRQAQRYQALYEFEQRIKSEESVKERTARRKEILEMDQEDFD